jgi:hypothetical protein
MEAKMKGEEEKETDRRRKETCMENPIDFPLVHALIGFPLSRATMEGFPTACSQTVLRERKLGRGNGGK